MLWHLIKFQYYRTRRHGKTSPMVDILMTLVDLMIDVFLPLSLFVLWNGIYNLYAVKSQVNRILLEKRVLPQLIINVLLVASSSSSDEKSPLMDIRLSLTLACSLHRIKYMPTENGLLFISPLWLLTSLHSRFTYKQSPRQTTFTANSLREIFHKTVTLRPAYKM